MSTGNSSQTGWRSELNDIIINSIYLVINKSHILNLVLQSTINIEEIYNHE